MRPVTLALVVLAALALGLNLPTSLADFGRLATWALPVELVVAVALVSWAPAAWRRAVALAAACAVAWFVVFRLVDWVVWQMMGRPVTLLFDVPRLGSLLEVARESLGLAALVLLVGVTLVPLLLVTWATASALRTVASTRLARPVSFGAAAAAMIGMGVGAVTPGDRVELPLVSAHGASQALAQYRRAGSAAAAEARWRQRIDDDRRLGLDRPDLLTGVAGVDVWLVFVESYGRTVLEDRELAGRLEPSLAAFERDVRSAGLAAASGWLRSPTVGGQSWLAHATLTSGVRTDDEASFDIYLRSAHADLSHLFARAGHRSVLVAPGMSRPFPEATTHLGFRTFLGAPELGYAGPRFDWVTMPDQFTLESARRLLASQPEPAAPLFVQVALVGSHAPFTPRPTLIADWNTIGDGSLYASLPARGDPPAAVWRDRDRLRAAYVDAIALALETLGGFANRVSGRDVLMILVGDHEPASWITGAPEARTVPMHVLASNARWLEPFVGWGFVPGLRPESEGAVHDMDQFRSFLVTVFGRPDLPVQISGAGG